MGFLHACLWTQRCKSTKTDAIMLQINYVGTIQWYYEQIFCLAKYGDVDLSITALDAAGRQRARDKQMLKNRSRKQT